MIYKVGIIIFIYLFVACSSTERKEAVTVGGTFPAGCFLWGKVTVYPSIRYLSTGYQAGRKG